MDVKDRINKSIIEAMTDEELITTKEMIEIEMFWRHNEINKDI